MLEDSCFKTGRDSILSKYWSTMWTGYLVHLHKYLGEMLFHFCVNISFQLQNAPLPICWNLHRQRMQRLLAVEKNSKELQRVWKDRLWGNDWAVVTVKRLQARFFQPDLQSRPVSCKETILQNVLINHVEQFSVTIFRSSFGKIGRESLSSWPCLFVPATGIHLTTSLDESCKRFEFQTDPNYSVDLRQTYLALKLKFVKGRGNET